MEKSKKILLDVIYGLVVFSLLSFGFNIFIILIMSTYDGNPISIPIGGLLILMLALFSVLILTIISFFSKSRGVKISALISQGALFLITITLILVDYSIYSGFLRIALCSALIFLMDMLVYKSWKIKQDASKLNELECIEKSKKIILNVIYGLAAFYLFSIGVERLSTFIAHAYNNGFENTYKIELIMTTIAIFLVLVLTAVSFFSKNRVVSILALISQGILFLSTIILILANVYGYPNSEQIAFYATIIFLIDMFVNKIWKAKQDISKLDKADLVDLIVENT